MLLVFSIGSNSPDMFENSMDSEKSYAVCHVHLMETSQQVYAVDN